MLAVTEVNDCSFCSFAHTKMALEAGMSNEEIYNMLAGVTDDVPEEEMSGIVFSQHYAETRGYPSKKSWERIVEIYGLREAKGILGVIRVIMFGNAAGVVWGSFLDRFKKETGTGTGTGTGKEKETDERSSLLYEIGMILGTFIFLPIALIHALLAKLLRRPVIQFKAAEQNQ